MKTPVEVPDISTADKAWKVMGIDIEKERKAKKEFLETVVPQWVKEAKANGKLAEDTATKNNKKKKPHFVTKVSKCGHF